MIHRLRQSLACRTPTQRALVAATFMLTSVGALALAIWLARRNKRGV